MPQHPSHRQAPSSPRRFVLCTLLLALLLAALVPGLVRAGLLANGSVFLPMIVGESEGGTPTQVPTPEVTPPPDDTPEVTPPPSEIEEWLIGSWSYFASSGSIGLGITYEFREDGTFFRAVGSVVQYSYSVFAFEGRYRVEGDRIVFYDQLKSEGHASSWDELWRIAESSIKDVPVEDEERRFTQASADTLILHSDEVDTELTRDES